MKPARFIQPAGRERKIQSGREPGVPISGLWSIIEEPNLTNLVFVPLLAIFHLVDADWHRLQIGA